MIIVVWGPSVRLASEDQEIQSVIIQMKESGIILEACKACSDQYGVSSDLRELGIDVKYMGVGLTEMLKSGWTTLTF